MKIFLLKGFIFITLIEFINSDLSDFFQKKYYEIISLLSKQIDTKDIISLTNSKCYEYINSRISVNNSDSDYSFFFDSISLSGYDYNKLGDEQECLENNWTYLFFLYKEELNNYGIKLSDFLDNKLLYKGICIFSECFDFYFENNETINKLITKLTKIKEIKLYGFNQLIKNQTNPENEEQCYSKITSMYQNHLCSKYKKDFEKLKYLKYILIIWIIIRIIISFHFITMGDPELKGLIGSIIQIDSDNSEEIDNSKEDEKASNNFLTENIDISQTKFYIFSKGLSFFSNIKYMSSKESINIEQLLGIKVYILFFIILCENSYSLLKIPNTGMSIYNIISNPLFCVIKFFSYSYDFYKIICGAILGYTFMEYLKIHKIKDINGMLIFKFYFKSLPYVISFLILHYLQSFFIIIGEQFYPTIQFEFFNREIFNKTCFYKTYEIFLFPSSSQTTCYKSAFFTVSEFYCFLLLTSFAFILVKLEKKIIDFFVFCIYLLFLFLLKFMFKDPVGNYTIQKIYGNINMIRQPLLFIILYYLGFNFGIMFFYHNNLSYIYNEFLSKENYIYMPFSYNYYFMKCVNQIHKYLRRIIGIIVSILLLLVSLNYYFIRQNYIGEDNILFFNNKYNLIDMIYLYEGIVSGFLFTILIIIILIASTFPLWKKLFSNDLILSLSKISFVIFNCITNIITITYCRGNINQQLNLKNIFLSSFPNFILIFGFSMIYGILIEIPLVFFTKEILFKEEKKELE